MRFWLEILRALILFCSGLMVKLVAVRRSARSRLVLSKVARERSHSGNWASLRSASLKSAFCSLQLRNWVCFSFSL